MRKVLWVFSILILLSLLMSTGCAGSPESPTFSIPQASVTIHTPAVTVTRTPKTTPPAATSTAPPTSTLPASPALPASTTAPEAAQPLVLSFAYPFLNTDTLHVQGFGPLADKLARDSKGRLKFEYYADFGADDPETILKAVKNGAVDLACLRPSDYPDLFPITLGTTLPFLGQKNAKSSSMTPLEFMNKYNFIQEEWKDFKVLFFWSNGPLQLHTAAKEVRKIEDIRGLKLAADRTLAPCIEAMKAVPVILKPGEFVEAVRQGKVEGGWFTNSEVFEGLKIGEVCKYHTQMNLLAEPWCIVMNLKKWNSLSSLQQNDLGAICDIDGATLFFTPAASQESIAYSQIWSNKEHKCNDLSPYELEPFISQTVTVTEKWMGDMKARGLDGGMLWADLKAISSASCST